MFQRFFQVATKFSLALEFSENIAFLAFSHIDMCRRQRKLDAHRFIWGYRLCTSYIACETGRNIVTPLLPYLLA
jgi:hypothetical protein